MEETCNFYVPPMNLAMVSKQLNNYSNTMHACNKTPYMHVTIKHSKKIPVKMLNALGWGSPPWHKRVLYPYSLLNALWWVPLPCVEGCYTLIACFVRFGVHSRALGLVSQAYIGRSCTSYGCLFGIIINGVAVPLQYGPKESAPITVAAS